MQNQIMAQSYPAPAPMAFVAGAPGSPIYLQPASPPAIRHGSYRHRRSSGLGVTQIVLGCLCILFNAVSLAIGSFYSLSFVGHGFWCGILFIITGSFGVSAGVNKTKCKIVAYMVLCVISACFTVALLFCGIIGSIMASTYADYDDCRHYGYNYYDYHYRYNPCTNVRPIAAMEGCMAVCGFIAAILFIWGSVLGCATKVCSCCQCCFCCPCCKDTYQSQTVPYNYMTANGQAIQTMPYQMTTMPYHQGMIATIAMPPAYYEAPFAHPNSAPAIPGAIISGVAMATGGSLTADSTKHEPTNE